MGFLGVTLSFPLRTSKTKVQTKSRPNSFTGQTATHRFALTRWAKVDPSVAKKMRRETGPLSNVQPGSIIWSLGTSLRHDSESGEPVDIIYMVRFAPPPETCGGGGKCASKNLLPKHPRIHKRFGDRAFLEKCRSTTTGCRVRTKKCVKPFLGILKGLPGVVASVLSQPHFFKRYGICPHEPESKYAVEIEK